MICANLSLEECIDIVSIRISVVKVYKTCLSLTQNCYTNVENIDAKVICHSLYFVPRQQPSRPPRKWQWDARSKELRRELALRCK